MNKKKSFASIFIYRSCKFLNNNTNVDQIYLIFSRVVLVCYNYIILSLNGTLQIYQHREWEGSSNKMLHM